MHSDFGPILEVAYLMQRFSGPWFVAGGWAIDLFLREVTRPHSDIEIGIYRCDQHVIRKQFPDWSLDKAVQTDEGGKWVSWAPDEDLQLPIHQIRAVSAHGGVKEFEFFLNERDGTNWTSRRHAGLSVPMNKVQFDSFLNIPTLNPEVQLLFKAKQTRAKDQADFELTLPRLNQIQVDWLAAAMRRFHPAHPWLARL